MLEGNKKTDYSVVMKYLFDKNYLQQMNINEYYKIKKKRRWKH